MHDRFTDTHTPPHGVPMTTTALTTTTDAAPQSAAGPRDDSIVVPLRAADLDEVVATDASLCGRRRHAYFERRLHAAVREPRHHVQFAARISGYLLGYLLARRTEGEFGHDRPAFRIEVVGVHPESQGSGIGHTLLEALERFAAARGVHELRTQSRWNDSAMLRYLDECGFELAPSLVLEARVSGRMLDARPPVEAPQEDGGARREIDYGNQSASDFERLARDGAEFSSMRPEDLAQIVRLDRRRTGVDREAYLAGALDEAMGDSAVRVSLCARIDGAIVGFVMAKVDLGDFGRTEPVAVLDTIGVDPGFEHRGIGHGLLSQLCMNLSALRVDRLESLVACNDFDLLGFLHAAGFAPSQRLAFVKRW
jgi:ribosomal protein S18 acetylase RimI-like enzyme